MMCEHELRGEEAWAFLVNSLAAANARAAELEKERNNYLSFGQGGASFTDSQWLDKLATAEQRAEAAEARVAELEEKCKAQDDAIRIMENSIADDVEKTKQLERRAEKAEAKAKQLIKKLTYNTPSFRDGECDEELLTINKNELVPLKSCVCDRLKQAEAQCAAMRNCHNCKHYDIKWDNDGDWVQRCKYNTMEIDECRELTKWESEGLGTAIISQNKRMREALTSLLLLCEYGADFRNGNVCQVVDEGNMMADRIVAEAKAALEEKP